ISMIPVLLFALVTSHQRSALPPAAPPSDGLAASQPVPVSDRVLSPSWGREHQPAIAAGPSQALVAWSGTKAVRVAPDGALLDSSPIMLPSTEGPIDVAWDGSRYLVAADGVEGITVDTRLIAVSTARAVTTLARVPGGFLSAAIATRGDEILVIRGS